VSASIGESLWDAHTVEGVVSAVATRTALHQPVRLKLERKVKVGAWQADEGDCDEVDDDDIEDDDDDKTSLHEDPSLSGSHEGGRNRVEAAVVENVADGRSSQAVARQQRPKASSSSSLQGIDSTVLALEELQRMDVSSTSTQQVLLERCGYLIYK
jgi:hypothetical protein